MSWASHLLLHPHKFFSSFIIGFVVCLVLRSYPPFALFIFIVQFSRVISSLMFVGHMPIWIIGKDFLVIGVAHLGLPLHNYSYGNPWPISLSLILSRSENKFFTWRPGSSMIVYISLIWRLEVVASSGFLIQGSFVREGFTFSILLVCIVSWKLY